MKLDSVMTTGNLTLEDLMRELRDIRKAQKNTVDDLNTSYELLYDQ